MFFRFDMNNPTFQLFPDQASTIAPQVDHLYYFLCTVTAFFTLLIFLLVVYMGLRYRRRQPNERPANPITHNLPLEIVWTAIPAVLVLIMFFWATRLYIHMYNPPRDAIDIHVIGKQWMWKMQHPTGRREINELHLPTGQPVRLTVASQDVIHSFFIPAFRMKQDAVPGRYTVIWFTPTRPGDYHLFCAEYCGAQHSGMIGRVVVMEPQQYQAWAAGSPSDQNPVVAGAILYKSLNCYTCHGVQAPTLARLYESPVHLSDGSTVTADENYLRESILDSTAKIVSGYQPIMPSFRGQITEEQLFDLIAYIKDLKNTSQEKSNASNMPIRPAPTDRAGEPTPNLPQGRQSSEGPKPARK